MRRARLGQITVVRAGCEREGLEGIEKPLQIRSLNLSPGAKVLDTLERLPD
jgi:hypothetical protein